jgi:hypothetical protein
LTRLGCYSFSPEKDKNSFHGRLTSVINLVDYCSSIKRPLIY